MQKIIHLDCTLRDGGYYNNWKFDTKLVQLYLHSLKEIKVDYIEIGFRFFDKIKSKGKFAYCEENFLNKLKIPANIKLAVMINLSELIIDNKYNNILIKKNFVHQGKSKIKLVRIACHFHELKFLSLVSKDLKDLGYQVAINLMQISEKKEKEIIETIKFLKKINPIVIYFADSLGSLDAKKTLKIIKIIKKFWKKDIGIHTHDNLGNALRNSLYAQKNGVRWIDTTVTGMGRGPGNTKTELAIFEFEKIQKKSINVLPLLNLVRNQFRVLHNKYLWGTNTYYYLAGLWGIHPTFVQEMISADFSSEEILKNLNSLKSIGGQKFSRELINRDEQFYVSRTKGTWEPQRFIKNKDVLILGSGPSLNQYKKKVEQFIKLRKPFVFLINNKNILKNNLINFRLACHTLRILIDIKNYKKNKIPIILPLRRFSDQVRNSLRHLKKYDFGLQVKKNIFDFKKNYGIAPNSLAFSYALCIANSGSAKKIFLAGFDGYVRNHPKKIEMDQTLKIYKKTAKHIKLLAITPTKYDLD